MRWPNVPIREIGKVTTGSTPKSGYPRYFGGAVPFVTPSDLGSGEPIKFSPRTLTVEGAEQVRLVSEGSVLISCIGTLGKVGYAGTSLATNQQINSIEFDRHKIYPRYGYYAAKLLSPTMERLAPATTLPIISKSKFENLTIPVPPLDEQRRIATILDEADELRRKRREALSHLETLSAVIFNDMFGNPVSNPRGWDDSLTLGEVANIASGVTKGRKLDTCKTRLVPYLAVANVQDRHLRLETIKTIEATEAEIARYRLLPGDLVLTEGGDPDKLGRGSLWPGGVEDCIHQNHIFRVRITSDRIAPLFLNWLIGGQRGRQYFMRAAKQTTGIASINMGQLRKFPLLTPPLELQRRFVDRMDDVDEIAVRTRASLACFNSLFAALQHRAFSGEL